MYKGSSFNRSYDNEKVIQFIQFIMNELIYLILLQNLFRTIYYICLYFLLQFVHSSIKMDYFYIELYVGIMNELFIIIN